MGYRTNQKTSEMWANLKRRTEHPNYSFNTSLPISKRYLGNIFYILILKP